jgi:hypothetical protein
MAGGMAGGMGGRNGRRPREENSHGDRPDYLAEDEETWISDEDRNRNVPRTIEWHMRRSARRACGLPVWRLAEPVVVE